MKPLGEDTIAWIEANAKADTARLRLRHAGDPDAAFAILQIECRRKAAVKLERTLSNRAFIFPTALSAEQCTGDRLAAFHSTLLRGSTLLDATAGLCIDAMAFASAGAQVTAIERDPLLAQAAVLNSRSAGLEARMEVICADSPAWLAGSGRRFDTIFIDPARRGDGGKRLFALSDCAPDILSLLTLLRARCSRLIVKASPMLDISAVARSLPEASRIIALGIPTECKELIAVIDFDATAPAEPQISAVTLGQASESVYTFTPAQESAALPSFAVPSAGHTLLSPWPAVMKAQPFRKLCADFGVSALSPHCHLYTLPSSADSPLPPFPGQPFRILEVLPFSKQTVRHLRDAYPRLDITARAFPLTAPALSARLRVKEGGPLRLFAVSAPSPLLLITSPI